MPVLYVKSYLMQAELSDEYINRAYIVAVVIGLVFFSLFLVAAIKQRRARGLGITAGVFQIFGAALSPVIVVIFHSPAITTMYGYSILSLASIPITVSWILALIYIARIKSEISKAFSITALVVHIVRFVIICPMCIRFDRVMDLVKVTEADQISWDYLYYAFYAIPFILIFIGSLVGKKKDTPVIARAVAYVQPVEETITTRDVSEAE